MLTVYKVQFVEVTSLGRRWCRLLASYSNVGFKAFRDFVAAMFGDVVGAPRIPRQHALDIQSDSIARLMIPIRILSS
jgi:hypothetical protein